MKQIHLPLKPLNQAEKLRIIRWLEKHLKIPAKDLYQSKRTL
jgi:hypothetical protein